MQKLNINRILYRLRHQYLTLNNVVIAIAFLIVASWVWGSLDMMQRNYALQKELDYKTRELALTELQRDSLELQKNYYETAEYQELAVRESIGLVRPGEKALILPKSNTEPKPESSSATVASTQSSNLEQWINFLFGGYSRSIEGGE